ncbi:MAG: hypothetical protein HY914_04915 [Desulfomonile tiedjei]|nr:hypothetical protein [Desulfomonile tiedjei]
MKHLPAVIVWAVAFAFVEAAVVEYLRALYYPLDLGGFRFPLLTLEQLNVLGDHHWRRLAIELGREVCTLVMLAMVGIVAARNRREAWAHFMVAFAVWDIFFYVWLKIFLGWPADFMTWDLLFLIPVPWVSPVLAPLLVSVTMLAAGVTVLFFESQTRPLAPTGLDWAIITCGGLTVIASFCLDYRNIMAGGLPNPFNWLLFFAGLGTAAITFVLVVRRELNRGPGSVRPVQ